MRAGNLLPLHLRQMILEPGCGTFRHQAVLTGLEVQARTVVVRFRWRLQLVEKFQAL